MFDRSYEKEIERFLAKYEMTLPSGVTVPGREMFKQAPSWDHPIQIKEGISDPTLPEDWLGVVARVGEILGKGELGLNPYDGQIEIIDAEQMIDAYSSHGLPNSFSSWMQGKSREQIARNYNRGMSGLAYEIVINSAPAIAYCMEQNTKMMMMLVIFHACQGHSHFFRNNYLFKEFSEAETILAEQRIRQDFVRECREKYGTDAVDRILDACHALRGHDVSRYNRPPSRSPEEEIARRRRLYEAYERSFDLVLDTTLPSGKLSKIFADTDLDINAVEGSFEKDENILRFIALNGPRLKDWERQLILHVCAMNQYFYPQRQTKVMNEGCATFVHYRMMERMMEMGLIDDAMWMQFIASHTNVVAQPDHDDPRFNGINPYALGFAMCNDIVRICEAPTDEDRERFQNMPDFAGNTDWRTVWRKAMEEYRDCSFIEQFLSPKIIRDFKLFVLKDDEEQDEYYSVEAVHNEQGYDDIRFRLADQYTHSNHAPNIEVSECFLRHDRTLVLRHQMNNGQYLPDDTTNEVMRYIHNLWQYPVILETIGADNKVVKTFSCPSGAARPKISPSPS